MNIKSNEEIIKLAQHLAENAYQPPEAFIQLVQHLEETVYRPYDPESYRSVVPELATPAPDQAGDKPKSRRKDVNERVERAHNQLKAGATESIVFRHTVRIEKETYRMYCEGVTGEKPLV